MKAAKIMKAKFDSKCRDEDDLTELCDGIKAGDEIIYWTGTEGAGFHCRRVTRVGHLACRAGDFEKRHVVPLVRIMKSQPSPATDEVIDGIAQTLREKWEERHWTSPNLS